MKKFVFFLCIGGAMVFGQAGFVDPIFNLQAIQSDPLDAKILNTTTKEGIVIQEIEFTAEKYQGKDVRIYGIIAFPENCKNMPAILWCQAGMAPANTAMPVLFAKRGYVCMCITLPHSVWKAWVPFDTKNPGDANMTHYAIAQMRAITYLSMMPQVDPERIGVGGSSYGGFFSTLIAGADNRIKCGMSFFAGGNMAYGTHIPQFTGLKTMEDVEVWNKTIDPALRLRYRKVPFLWGVAANDNWFYLPSVVKTYKESIGEKRIAIIPLWEHGFPEEIDQQLFSWFDVYLKGTIKPYNQVFDLNIKKKNNKLFASWSFSGEKRVKKAELIISYGKVAQWKYWIHRNYIVLPAKIEGNTATAEIPVVDPEIEMLIFGNITDEDGFVISSVPVETKAIDHGIKKGNSKGMFNLFQWKVFDRETEKIFERMGMTEFCFDYEIRKDGMPSLKVDPSKMKKKKDIRLKLHHVPLHSHILRMFVRAEKPVEISVSVRALELPDSQSDIVKILRNQSSEKTGIPEFTKNFIVEEKWKIIEIECPYQGEDIEGYYLVITPGESVIWINNIVFLPIWKR